MNFAGDFRAASIALALDALALACAAGLVALTLGVAAPDTPPATRLLMVIAVPALLSPLFGGRGISTPRAITARVAGWAVATALLAGATRLAVGGLPVDRLAAPLLVACAIVVATLLATNVVGRTLHAIGVHATAAGDWARWLVVTLLWLLSAAPLWLGPLADLGARSGPAPAGMIVAASPLVHLGVAAGQDLLRTQWFYGHSNFGGLQFGYPAPAGIAIAWLGAMLVLAGLAFVLSRLDAASRPPS